MQKLKLRRSIIGKLSPTEEKKVAKELISLVTDTYPRFFVPFIIFDSKKVKKALRRAKSKLTEIGV